MIDWLAFVNEGGDITDHTEYHPTCDPCELGFHESCEVGLHSKEQLKWSGCKQKYCQCACREGK